MSLKEAIEDGIEHYYDSTIPWHGSHGAEIFLVPCAGCGQKIKSKTYSRMKPYLCSYCKLNKQKKTAALESQLFDSIVTKGEKRFMEAVEKIRRSVKDFESYQNAVAIARKGCELYGSIPEAMVAIELLRKKQRVIPQKKVGRYRVDFYLPDEKIVLEVDGSIYHRDDSKKQREGYIQLALGFDHKIIHIPAELISKNIQKLSAYIEAAKKLP